MSEANGAVLTVRGLTKRVGLPPRTLLMNLALEVRPREMVAVCGRSGCGKSTLLNIVGGLDGSFSGEVHVDGRSLSSLTDGERSHVRLYKVGMVFQSFYLVEHLSLLNNVLLPARFANARDRDAAADRAPRLLKAVGLGSRMHDLPAPLSGGERQRVAIARALVMNPALLLADEPTGNLDRTTADGVLRVFRELTVHAGSSVLMVTHDAAVASMADRTLWLTEGALLDKGNGSVVSADQGDKAS